MSKGRRPNPIVSFIHRGNQDDQPLPENGASSVLPSNPETTGASIAEEPVVNTNEPERKEPDKQGKQFGSRNSRSGKVPFKTELPPELLEAVKDAAYWRRERMAWITETALRAWLESVVAANGEPFNPRPEDLPTGRPMK